MSMQDMHLAWLAKPKSPPPVAHLHQTVCAAATRVASRAFWLEPQRSATKFNPEEFRFRVKQYAARFRVYDVGLR